MGDAPITRAERDVEMAWARSVCSDDFLGVSISIRKYEAALTASDARVKELEAENARLQRCLWRD